MIITKIARVFVLARFYFKDKITFGVSYEQIHRAVFTYLQWTTIGLVLAWWRLLTISLYSIIDVTSEGTPLSGQAVYWICCVFNETLSWKQKHQTSFSNNCIYLDQNTEHRFIRLSDGTEDNTHNFWIKIHIYF